MEKITQKSTQEKVFWQPEFSGNTLLETTFWCLGKEILIPETDLSNLQDGDKIWIEDDNDPLHLISEDSGVTPSYLSESERSSPGPVIWKEGGTIYYLYHEQQ